jgi:hypothetical protein
MASDPNDEVARFRARRNRDRGASNQQAADDHGWAAEQEAAIARARESWLLSRLKRDEIADGSSADAD